MNGMAIQSIFDGSERDENGKIKEDVIRLVREVFDHFSRGRKTPVSSARKWRSDSSHRNEHGESEHQISVLTIQDFLRVARAARLVDHGKKNVRLPIDVTTLDMVYRRVNLQLRSEPHRMTFEAFQVALCRIARFKYVYVPEQWIEDFETDFHDDASRTHAKDTEALKRLVIDHIVPLGNHLRSQKSDDKQYQGVTEGSLNFRSLEKVVKMASQLVIDNASSN